MSRRGETRISAHSHARLSDPERQRDAFIAKSCRPRCPHVPAMPTSRTHVRPLATLPHRLRLIVRPSAFVGLRRLPLIPVADLIRLSTGAYFYTHGKSIADTSRGRQTPRRSADALLSRSSPTMPAMGVEPPSAFLSVELCPCRRRHRRLRRPDGKVTIPTKRQAKSSEPTEPCSR